MAEEGKEGKFVVDNKKRYRNEAGGTIGDKAHRCFEVRPVAVLEGESERSHASL